MGVFMTVVDAFFAVIRKLLAASLTARDTEKVFYALLRNRIQACFAVYVPSSPAVAHVVPRATFNAAGLQSVRGASVRRERREREMLLTAAAALF
jgi:hypothetical protein